MNKKMKALLLLISIIAVALIGIFIWERVHVSFHNEEKVESSISIIGGEDGPTSVFLSDKISNELGDQNMGYTQINMDVARSIFEVPGEYIILDVRRADEFAEGRIPGAINIANEDIGEEEIAELPDKNQTIYVYCRSGNRSKQAAAKLVNLGYKNIIECGGIIDWKGDIEK